MKYTIEGLCQQKLIDLGLDNTDALIIRWFLDFKATDQMVKVKEYLWVKYDAIIKDLPCIGISNKEVMARRFKKYINVGIMIGHTERNIKGVFSCYNTTDKILDLIYMPTQKSNGADSKVDTPIDSKVESKDYSINLNSSSKNKKEFFIKPSLDEIKNYIKLKNLIFINPEIVYNFYESKNWMVGKNKMSCWKSAISGWNSREKEKAGNFENKKPKPFINQNAFHDSLPPELKESYLKSREQLSESMKKKLLE